MECVLTILSMVQFLALKISEIDCCLESVANPVRQLSLLPLLLNYTRPHNLKSTYENTMMKC